MSAVHNTWRHIPSGIPRTEAGRKRKLKQVRAELKRLMAQDSEAEPRSRIAQKVAEIYGAGQLFQK
jgi:hypothetical protein